MAMAIATVSIRRRSTSASTPSAPARCATSLPKEVYAKLVGAIRQGKKLDADDRADRRAGHQGVGDLPRRDALHALVPAADRSHRREARRLSLVRRQAAADGVVLRRAAHSERARRVELSVRRTSRHVGGARLHGVEPGVARCSSWSPASTRTLCIPSVFIGYNGEALDEMTPLLRSSDVLSEKAIELLELLGDKGVLPRLHHARTGAGVLPHRPHALRAAPRPRHGGPHAHRRTAAARAAARGPLLRRHPRARAGLHRRGRARALQARCADRHAAQRGGALPVRDGADVRGDRHQRRPQPARDVRCCDASRCATACRRCCTRSRSPASTARASTATGRWRSRPTTRASTASNLLKPGKTPHQNIRFLLFLAAVLKGVHKHAGLLRAGIGTSGNEHRLGANEAPPAIISVFMGEMLTQRDRGHRRGKDVAIERASRR